MPWPCLAPPSPTPESPAPLSPSPACASLSQSSHGRALAWQGQPRPHGHESCPSGEANREPRRHGRPPARARPATTSHACHGRPFPHWPQVALASPALVRREKKEPHFLKQVYILPPDAWGPSESEMKMEGGAVPNTSSSTSPTSRRI
jgi:hypothetical protein